MPQHQYQSVPGEQIKSCPTVVISKAAEVMHLPNGVWSCMQSVSVLSHLLLLLFPFYFEQVRIWQHLLLCKWSVLATFYFLLFTFLLLCLLLILHFGKWKKTACQTEVVELKWPRGTAMGVWTAFIVTTSWENCDKDLVTLSLALLFVIALQMKTLPSCR